MTHAVHRWIFTDHTGSWTVPLNPNRMTPLHEDRNVHTKVTTAVDGNVLMFEARATPQQWEFGGTILNDEHYEKLREWVYDHHQRVTITDHFGREIRCKLISFKPEPKRTMRRYWRHEYTIQALVISVGSPTVFDYPD